MKFKWDKKYLHWGVTAFCVIAGALLFQKALIEWSGVVKFLHRLNAILNPIIIGVIIAYILTPILNFFEKRFLIALGMKAFHGNGRKARMFSRVLGILIALILLLGLMILILVIAVPQIYTSLHRLVSKMTDYYNVSLGWLSETFNKSTGTEAILGAALLRVKDFITNWLNTGLLPWLQTILVNVSTGIVDVLLKIFDFFIGIIVSIYVLYRREEFVAKTKKLAYSLFSKGFTDSLVEAALHVHRTFGQYIVGKIIDAVIMTFICAVFMVVFKIPYAALVSAAIGLGAMIPFFGLYFGTIPSIFLILLEDPFKCAVFTVFILILHAFNGNIMEPKIIGTSTGVTGFWVIFSVFFFGGLFGVVGMLLGVPIFAVIYSSIGTWSERRLKNKNMPAETYVYKERGPVEQRKNE